MAPDVLIQKIETMTQLIHTFSTENAARFDLQEAEKAKLYSDLREQESQVQALKYRFNQDLAQLRQDYTRAYHEYRLAIKTLRAAHA